MLSPQPEYDQTPTATLPDGRVINLHDQFSKSGFLLTRMRGPRYLPFTTWDWHTKWYDDFELDAGRRNVLLSTARRRVPVTGPDFDLGFQAFYTFDLASGALVSQRSAGAWVLWAYGIALGSLLVVLLFATGWSLRRIGAARYRRGFPVEVGLIATAAAVGFASILHYLSFERRFE